MTPTTTSLSGLLANGITYHVPIFQRDYSWTSENWTDLWEDIVISVENGTDHYMGAVVVQQMGEKNFRVIDGQQRLTTLSILALAVIKNIQGLVENGIDPSGNEERIKELRRSFLGQRDPGSLLYSSKLTLNENNDSFYQSRLLQLQQPVNEKTLPDSDKLMWQAFSYFYLTVKKYFKEPTGIGLANFLNKSIGDRLMFIKIEVEDEMSAYTLFETLNYRGVDLTVTDLLKNYLFSLLSQADVRVAKDIWRKIANAIGLEKFPSFLRHYWMSRNPSVRQDRLFNIIRSNIKTNQHVFDLLRKLECSAALYDALQDPFSPEWKGDKDRFNRIRELKLFGVNQQLPLLMVAKEHFTTDEYDKLLWLIAVIAFRYSVVGGRQPNVMEEMYNEVCLKIHNQTVTSSHQVYTLLKSLYVPDTDFKNDFATLQVYSNGRDKKLARYILFQLENLLMQGGDRDYEYDAATIEHILPENAPAAWDQQFPPITQDNYTYRLGNYTLLEDHLNRECEVKLMAEKHAAYQKSQYEMSRKNFVGDWSQGALELRQQEMAKWASSIWRVPYTDAMR